ncbi:MAG: methyltransferase domain-containing protein, partial [Alphaproteobacteria bacterium]|nr:methyltransferase domain-containing protein [Alphaproteobacteria bacterium]
TDDLDAILSRCNATFLEGGLHSFSDVPDGCCDFVFSHSVLEHVPRADFAPLMGEIYRVLKPGGVSSHDVDFRDHLGGSLNHLRFSHRLWEAPWFARRSGFYTNRLLFSQMLGILRDAGFEAEIRNIDKWPKPALPRTALDPAFRSLEDNDLCTSHCFVILTKPTES